MPYANNKDADQPAHPCSLISIFVIRCLDSRIPLVTTLEISSLKLVWVADQAGLSLIWSQTPEDRFSRDVAHVDPDQTRQDAATNQGLHCLHLICKLNK